MSWSPLKMISARAAVDTAAPVRFSTCGYGPTGRYGRRGLRVSLRPASIEEPADVAFWSVGSSVDVLVGNGEHAGWLRLVPGHQLQIMRPGGQGKLATVLTIMDWPHLPAEKPPMTTAEFDSGPGWLEVRLPSWACPPTVATAATSPLLTPPRKGPVPSMISSLADTRAGMGGQGPIPMKGAGA
jgi:hypothetical protein